MEDTWVWVMTQGEAPKPFGKCQSAMGKRAIGSLWAQEGVDKA